MEFTTTEMGQRELLRNGYIRMSTKETCQKNPVCRSVFMNF